MSLIEACFGVFVLFLIVAPLFVGWLNPLTNGVS